MTHIIICRYTHYLLQYSHSIINDNRNIDFSCMVTYCKEYTFLYLTGYHEICHSAHMWYLDATTIKLTISILAELFFPSRCNTRVTHDREYPKRHNLECCVYYFLHSWAISKSDYILQQ